MAKENKYLAFSPEALVASIHQAYSMMSFGYRSANLEKELPLMEEALASMTDKTLDYSDDFEG